VEDGKRSFTRSTVRSFLQTIEGKKILRRNGRGNKDFSEENVKKKVLYVKERK